MKKNVTREKKSTWISFEEIKKWRDEMSNKNVSVEKESDKNLYKSNWISPEELKNSKEYIDEMRKLYTNINFEKNTEPYTGSSHRRLPTGSLQYNKISNHIS